MKARRHWMVAILAALPLVAMAQPVDRGAKQEVVAGAAAQLDGRTVYQLLLGEIALQRGDGEVAAQAYYEAAKRTRDAGVIGRGMQVAATARRYDLALEFGRQWVEMDPDSATARHALIGVLAALGRAEEMLPHLRLWLAKDEINRPRNITHLTRLFSGVAERDQVLTSLQSLLEPYGSLAESHYVLATAARIAGQRDLAIKEAREASRLKPDWWQPVMFEAQVLMTDAPLQAVEALTRFISVNPKNDDALAFRGRILAGMKRFPEARRDLDQALSLSPDDPEHLYPYAVVLLQMRDYAAAAPVLRKLSERDQANRAFANFQLALLDEDDGRIEQAMAGYRLLSPGEYYVSAQARLAQLLARQGKPDEGRKLLQEVRNTQSRLSDADQTRLTIAEAQILRETKQFEAAFDVLATAIKGQPDEPDLLYDQAMIAELLKRNDVVESNLTRLIALKPDNAHAYNALGYSYVDRNIRLQEARELIQKALALAPDDPFILDSMGWVLFRMGQAEEALKHLERAFKLRNDPEIAAHMGEVLWSLGRRKQAREVWEAARQKHPGNDVLADVIKKFIP